MHLPMCTVPANESALSPRKGRHSRREGAPPEGRCGHANRRRAYGVNSIGNGRHFCCVLAQNAPVPRGVPRPVGPSQPAAAWHQIVVAQEPLDPLTTSLRRVRWAHVYEAG